MARRRKSHTTLERRGRFIFGLLVLLTVAACMWWPYWQIEQVVWSGEAARAQALARAYLQDYHAAQFLASDGRAAEPLRRAMTEQLARFGPLRGEKEPRRVQFKPAAQGQPQVPPANLSPFEESAVQTFLRHADERRRWQPSGDALLFAQAFRAEAECIACHTEYKTGEIIDVVFLDLSAREANKTVLVNRLMLLVAGLLVVGFSIAFFYAVFRYSVVRPVRHLKDVADRVSEGDLKVRTEIDTGNELQDLSDAFNHMLDELAKSQADLRAATEARDAKLDDLAKANVALFEMNQVKNKFLTTMSHEFRTPLNSILGFAQILVDNPAVAADAKLLRYARNVLSSGRMLLEMINDLLDLAKIEAGRLQVRCEKVSPQDIVEVACGMVRPMLAETSLRFTHEVDPAVPLMMTDATKVQQVLYNLVSNAIKFTEQGEVRVAVRPVLDAPDAAAAAAQADGIAQTLAGAMTRGAAAATTPLPYGRGSDSAAASTPAPAATPAAVAEAAPSRGGSPGAPRVTHVAFAVADTGPGIPRDEHLRIFERFTQLDSSYTRRYRGTGLGLSIVKELTGLLGGTVTVDSEEGRGSVFTVVLPVDSSAAESRKAEAATAADA
ncbi:MAG: HAMP domain-containing protein [Planctomycetes bacterium]|nr:HAMP domain-containing protein [Planctomycetota bacterium]